MARDDSDDIRIRPGRSRRAGTRADPRELPFTARVHGRSIFGQIPERIENRRLVAAEPADKSRCCVNERLSVTAGWRAESTDCLSHNTVAIDTSKATDFCSRTGRLRSSSGGGNTSKRRRIREMFENLAENRPTVYLGPVRIFRRRRSRHMVSLPSTPMNSCNR